MTTNPYGSTATPTFTRDYAPGTSVTLTAVPAAGWVFKGWSGGASGTNTSTTIVMDGDKNVHARFEQFALTVNKIGNGQVSTVNGPPALHRLRCALGSQAYRHKLSVLVFRLPIPYGSNVHGTGLPGQRFYAPITHEYWRN